MNDIVQVIDGQKIADYEAFIAAIRPRQPGDKVKLGVQRGNDTKEIEVTLGERPGGPTRTRPYTYSYFGQSPNIQDQQGAKGHEYGGIYRSQRRRRDLGAGQLAQPAADVLQRRAGRSAATISTSTCWASSSSSRTTAA